MLILSRYGKRYDCLINLPATGYFYKVYSKFQLAANFFQYWLKASNAKGHGMHSPFVYEFITDVLNDKQTYPEYHKIEELRKKLLQDQTVLEIEDFGAGSASTRSSSRTIASIARNAAKPKKFGQLIYRIAKHYQSQHVLELGTSLGITTSYLASAHKETSVTTMEGAEAVAAVAGKNFRALEISSIKLVKGNFDETLDKVLKEMPQVDLAFIDGNHRQEPTVRYFEQLLKKVSNDSIIILDDIHWSEGMENAWTQVKANPAVRCSIDLFFIGIVFFRQEFREKRDFLIRF